MERTLDVPKPALVAGGGRRSVPSVAEDVYRVMPVASVSHGG
jgi:hypothetical protein